MEKLARADVRPMERGGEQDIEIEEGEWWYQEIRLVYIPEFYCFYPLTFQEKDSGQHHAEQ
jgi:hypothetical protein